MSKQVGSALAADRMCAAAEVRPIRDEIRARVEALLADLMPGSLPGNADRRCSDAFTTSSGTVVWPDVCRRQQ
jgi:hypothetical protein